MQRITIGMPVFNDVEFIEKSILSILAQDFKDFRLIISDDGSTDGSDLICLTYAQKDDRIEYIRQSENLGISKNMEFLLAMAESEFFMWAGDDDLWEDKFISEMIALLSNESDAISAFCPYFYIDEAGEKISNPRNFDYSDSSDLSRIKKLIKNPDDGFGYGVFRTARIKQVKFPVWKWPNKKTAYNNIFPSLCFYLAEGNYVQSKNPLFYKRVKTEKRINHLISGEGSAIKETFAFILRRLNLVCFSTNLLWKTNHKRLALRIFPIMFYYWFVISSCEQVKLAGRSFFRNRILRKGED
jgi:glycosyltransferase involved in cell wall biosynthesis